MEPSKDVPHFCGSQYCWNLVCTHYYSSSLLSRCLSSEFPFVKTLISDSLCLTYSSIGYNYLYGHSHQKFFNVFDTEVANTITLYRQQFGNYSPSESHNNYFKYFFIIPYSSVSFFFSSARWLLHPLSLLRMSRKLT